MKKLNMLLFVSVNLLLIFLILGSEIVSAQNYDKKVLIHYMGWYGDSLATGDDSLRPWKCGHADQPIIGRYDSRNKSTITYHLLLAEACGIDVLVLNLKDAYDYKTLSVLLSTINAIKNDNSTSFNLKFAISIDDGDFNLMDTARVRAKFTTIRDSILAATNNYLMLNDRPVIFIFNYAGHIEAAEYRSVADAVFEPNPILAWNEIDSSVVNYVDVFYPWVQPDASGWRANGLEWGKNYLDWFYKTASNWGPVSSLNFICGGVWPGFDDRLNTCWGENRWMARQNGVVYDSTWLFIHNYNEPKPLLWVYIETWNDWNEGTEIEPGIEYGYQYLKSTVKNINTFKNTTISQDTYKFTTAESIYVAYRMIETGQRDILLFQPRLKNAIFQFLKRNYEEAEKEAIKIITPVGINSYYEKNLLSNFRLNQNYPNPFNPSTQISYSIPNANFVALKIYDVLGKEVQTLVDNFQEKGTYFINFDASQLSSGIYFFKLQAGNDLVETRKMLLLR